MGNPNTKERELKGLIIAMEEFKLRGGLIITEDFEGEEKIGGKTIKYIPLWKWLLYPLSFPKKEPYNPERKELLKKLAK